MGLTEIVWYSLGIGTLFVTAFLTFSYYVSKRKNRYARSVAEGLNANKRSPAVKYAIQNRSVREIPSKVVFVSKHNELISPDQIAEPARNNYDGQAEKRYKEELINISNRENKFTKHPNKRRFTIVNNEPKYSSAGLNYVPSYSGTYFHQESTL